MNKMDGEQAGSTGRTVILLRKMEQDGGREWWGNRWGENLTWKGKGGTAEKRTEILYRGNRGRCYRLKE